MPQWLYKKACSESVRCKLCVLRDWVESRVRTLTLALTVSSLAFGG